METERFTLREFKSEDAKHLFEINEDWECVKYTGDSAFNSIEEATNLINNYDHYEKYGFGRWSVLHKETQEYLGWCGLKYDEALDEVDLGFRFYQKYWGKRICNRICQEMYRDWFYIIASEENCWSCNARE